MIKIIFSLSFIIATIFGIHAQDFQGMAVYESKTSTADFKSRFEGNKEMTPDMQKMIEERMKKMFEKTFILNFDKQASIYKEEEKLDTPGQGGGGMRMMGSIMGGGGTFYKNVKIKAYTVDKEFMGKEFLIKDSLPNLKWKMEADDKDMVVMQHQFIYKQNGKTKRLHSSLVMKGENQIHTAMAKTVGLPLAIGAVLILKEKIKQKGVLTPTISSIYNPVLKELEKHGVNFIEEEIC